MKAGFLFIAALLSSAALVAMQTNSHSVQDSFPLLIERNCYCRVIHVRFALEPNESDDIDSPTDWQEFRRNLATIYEQLAR